MTEQFLWKQTIGFAFFVARHLSVYGILSTHPNACTIRISMLSRNLTCFVRGRATRFTNSVIAEALSIK